jgi:hypothetical protein
MKQKQRVIEVPVPKEIWDADMSICSLITGTQVMKAWMDSIQNAIKQTKK